MSLSDLLVSNEDVSARAANAAEPSVAHPTAPGIRAGDDDEEEEEEEQEEEKEEEEEEEAPKKKGKGKSDDEDEDDPKKKGKAASKKGKGKSDDDDDDDAPKKGGGSLLYIIIGGVLLLCCCGCGGVGAAFYGSILGALGIGAAVTKDLGKDLNKTKGPDGGGGVKPVSTPEFKVSSEELAKEFLKDEKAGEAKYKDKVIEVTGEVTAVGPTLDQIMLKGAKKDAKDPVEFGIRLGVPEGQQAQAARFSKGQKIKAVGKYLSVMKGGWLTITDCTLTEIDKSKTVVISADDLATEFDKNPAAAEKKFKGPDIIITGIVENIRTEPDAGKVAVLKGSGKTRVVANVGNFGGPEVAKGHTLEIRANTEFLQVRNNEVHVSSRVIISSK